MKITNKQIKALNPCEDRFNNYLNFYKGKRHSKAQFLGLKNITHDDKSWVAFRLMPKENIRLAAADIAELVLPIFESKYPNDDRPRKAIEAARKSDITTNAAADAAYAAYASAAAANADAAAANADAAAANAAAAAAANAAAAAANAAAAAYAANTAAANAAAAYVVAYAFPDANAAARMDINKKIRTIILKYWK